MSCLSALESAKPGDSEKALSGTDIQLSLGPHSPNVASRICFPVSLARGLVLRFGVLFRLQLSVCVLLLYACQVPEKQTLFLGLFQSLVSIEQTFALRTFVKIGATGPRGMGFLHIDRS